ncbi:glutamate synthase large subunit [Marinobacter fonticola]|uniref:glutamate synthase large subunit n=1 Tax=Marinobacter fonticola TaxID=2603215 RepID=UPI0011E7D068|nr:glutamate synthase large subunit [Marinobacter fonticola]
MSDRYPAKQPRRPHNGLYDPAASYANCGVGALMDLKGRRSHALVADALRLLDNLDHRGARGAEEKTGDGAGILLQKPHDFLCRHVPELEEWHEDDYGVGQIFFPADPQEQAELVKMVEHTVESEGCRLLAWREVPVDGRDLGASAQAAQPVVKQVFVTAPEASDPAALDRRLYVLRRCLERAAAEVALAEPESFYVCSLDRRRLVYKGMLTCGQLPLFFPDLRDEDMTSALALVHSRFSTNTLGAWHLAHPYRWVAHNGEFNTLQGNINWVRTREALLASEAFGDDIHKLKPIIPKLEGSDSASFDQVLELLVASGRTLPHALRMLVPEAWNKHASMPPERRAFYEYSSTLMEPWDGPALVLATDGQSLAAILDRNGLRPCRYCVTRDDRLIMASETGVLDTPAEEVVLKGRLKPGQLFLADSASGRIVPDEEIFDTLTEPDHAHWLAQEQVALADLVQGIPAPAEPPDTLTLNTAQRAFGYTREAVEKILMPMADEAKDPMGAMGSDTPPAVLSSFAKPLYNYFLQQFAQVSNPPLDYIREDLVTSLDSHIGRQRNLLEQTPEHCRQLHLASPILDSRELAAIRDLDVNGIRATVIDLTFPQELRLEAAVDQMRAAAEAAIRTGYEMLILSDRALGPERPAIPALLAVSGLHHYLIRQGLRTDAALIVDSGEPCLVHHLCTLIGYGADAVHPWLAAQSLARFQADGGLAGGVDEPFQRYRKAAEGGILKVMSKMGISTLDSYKGAQMFEAVGLDVDFVDEYFAGTAARIPGVGLARIEQELRMAHAIAFSQPIPGSPILPSGGDLYWRRDGEFHQWNPVTIGNLQHALRTDNQLAYDTFADAINTQNEQLQTLRGLLDVTSADPVPLEDVESCASLMRRFSSGSMSFGALSREAHETIAAGMNRVGGKSGTGEGGEQVDRFGTERECSMKQIASGRFGVTHHYLAQARQIEIKMAQGSKPGEGGELPGAKVGEEIAEVRFTVPGVGLISPPPHHDIYSIEDLAQLIHDLKCANPRAEIHVKLVAKANVGTIAAGVAKARADAVLISGDSGGTGASVKTSIKQAGIPWELGLAETHQVLMETRLRSRIRVRVDGGLKTGRDVAIAALLGAEEFGFGTAPMVAVGCIMLRKCHCNTCSVGVATQDAELRKKFPGAPEHVVRYMQFVARELRAIMAQWGFRSLDEMIGRVDRLQQRALPHPRGIQPDLTALLYQADSSDTPRKVTEQHHNLDRKLDHRLLWEAAPALDDRKPVRLVCELTNRNRTFGTLLSAEVAHRYGADGLPEDTIVCQLTGTAGQSFGAFLAPGISLHLVGDANDYPGKGLSGGIISIATPAQAGFDAATNTLLGNVALYGATAGQAYFNGRAGERFAVRNSGALTVVEGIGDHGCEYMTGGTVVVLGPVGRNFGAGMSGGEAYLLCENGDAQTLEQHINPAMVHTEAVEDERDRALLKRLLENHVAYTGSAQARRLLDDWDAAADRFIKVIPGDYQAVVERYRSEGRDVRTPIPTAARAIQRADASIRGDRP